VTEPDQGAVWHRSRLAPARGGPAREPLNAPRLAAWPVRT
jgi:hypothetical protein